MRIAMTSGDQMSLGSVYTQAKKNVPASSILYHSYHYALSPKWGGSELAQFFLRLELRFRSGTMLASIGSVIILSTKRSTSISMIRRQVLFHVFWRALAPKILCKRGPRIFRRKSPLSWRLASLTQ